MSNLVPIDIFGSPEVVGRPELTRDMIPEKIWDFANDTSYRMGVNTAAVAISCIGAACGAIRDGWKLQPKLRDNTWKQAPILWIAVTGQPSVKKTPAIEAALAPLRILEAQWIEEDMVAWEEYEKEKRLYDLVLKKWENDEVKGKNDGESGYPTPRPQEPAKPIRRRLIMEDLTPEAVVPIAQDNPDNLLVAVDELMEWIGSFDAYRNGASKDQQFYLKAYNGQSTTVDRVNRHLHAKRLALNVIGGIQEERLTELGGKMKRDGFLPRFIFVTARTTGQHDDDPDQKAIDAYEQMIVDIANAHPVLEHEQCLKMSQLAVVVREELMLLTEDMKLMPTTPPGLVDHLGKWDGLFARLCVVYHLCEYAGGDIPGEVSETTALRVRALMVRFLLPEAARVFGEIIVQTDNINTHARWIAGYIIARGLETVSLRELSRAYSKLRGKNTEIRNVMKLLERLAWVEHEGTDLVDVKSWSVNPQTHELFGERAVQEREHRLEVRQKIQDAASRMRERKTA